MSSRAKKGGNEQSSSCRLKCDVLWALLTGLLS